MVEGPSCKRKAERLQVLCGQALISAIVLAALHRCEGELVRRVLAVGKELFVVLETAVLRLHFGMSGGAEFLAAGTPMGRSPRQPVSLSCEFTRGVLQIRGATAKVVSHAYLAAAEARRTRDVLNAVFDREAVLALVFQAGHKQVCDVVMDQCILPGVGNVIKVEGLFAASVYPFTRADELPRGKWCALLEGLRDCAQRWYASLRGRGRLVKSCYGCQSCSRCRGRVMLVREGDLQRVTYFCPRCQSAGSNGKGARELQSAASPPTGGAHTGAALFSCADGPDGLRSAKAACNNHLAPTIAATDVAAVATLPAPQPRMPPSSSSGAAVAADQALAHLRSETSAMVELARPSVGRRISTPSCACGRRCSLKQTFKDGPNRERHFFCCVSRRCKHFAWLDAQLPRCIHGPARLRRVLKMNANNGRYFASCPAPKGRGCGLFEWLVLDEAACNQGRMVHGDMGNNARQRELFHVSDTPPAFEALHVGEDKPEACDAIPVVKSVAGNPMMSSTLRPPTRSVHRASVEAAKICAIVGRLAAEGRSGSRNVGNASVAPCDRATICATDPVASVEASATNPILAEHHRPSLKRRRSVVRCIMPEKPLLADVSIDRLVDSNVEKRPKRSPIIAALCAKVVVPPSTRSTEELAQCSSPCQDAVQASVDLTVSPKRVTSLQEIKSKASVATNRQHSAQQDSAGLHIVRSPVVPATPRWSTVCSDAIVLDAPDSDEEKTSGPSSISVAECAQMGHLGQSACPPTGAVVLDLT
eukprot:TRINITY_DN37716_c0_g1_i1.p1 TRINITY_DN37716_c0_g1~~TRINITY_DN37716_c0_g1_i1.p1  ORF type:complete len:761 (+),score=85.40 TRINITY_DN37716_c0_g1_i1:58-2340(+)